MLQLAILANAKLCFNFCCIGNFFIEINLSAQKSMKKTQSSHCTRVSSRLVNELNSSIEKIVLQNFHNVQACFGSFECTHSMMQHVGCIEMDPMMRCDGTRDVAESPHRAEDDERPKLHLTLAGKSEPSPTDYVDLVGFEIIICV